MLTMAVTFAVVSAIVSGCSQSDLNRCIDSQMAVWQQKERTYEDQIKNYRPRYRDDETVVIGGVEVRKNALAYPANPGTKEEAEARANLRCGKIYAKEAD
jgi:hypothetical protein